jgi:hypothetical protein
MLRLPNLLSYIDRSIDQSIVTPFPLYGAAAPRGRHGLFLPCGHATGQCIIINKWLIPCTLLVVVRRSRRCQTRPEWRHVHRVSSEWLLPIVVLLVVVVLVLSIATAALLHASENLGAQRPRTKKRQCYHHKRHCHRRHFCTIILFTTIVVVDQNRTTCPLGDGLARRTAGRLAVDY